MEFRPSVTLPKWTGRRDGQGSRQCLPAWDLAMAIKKKIINTHTHKLKPPKAHYFRVLNLYCQLRRIEKFLLSIPYAHVMLTGDISPPRWRLRRHMALDLS